MPEPLCLLGNGNHAGVIAECAMLNGYTIAGYFGPEGRGTARYLGSDDQLHREYDQWRGHVFHLAVGGMPKSGVRQKVAERLAGIGLQWATIVHPSAWVSPSAHLGVGVFVGPRAVIHAHARLGDHVIVNSGAIVEHGSVLGYGVNFSPGAICGGGTVVGEWAFCGIGSIIRDHCTIGAGAVIAMGAVVVGNVREHMEVRGLPARHVIVHP